LDPQALIGRLEPYVLKRFHGSAVSNLPWEKRHERTAGQRPFAGNGKGPLALV
jgi:hypothetical protein